MMLVIGYGNPSRRDDGAGPALARMLGESGRRTRVRILTPHQLTPELALELAAPDVTAVLFVDAAVVSCDDVRLAGILEPRRIEPGATGSCLGHYFPPNVLLAYTHLLCGACPPAWLITIPGQDFGFGEGFSHSTAARLHVARINALELLKRLEYSACRSNTSSTTGIFPSERL